MDISIVLPAYQEYENLKRILPIMTETLKNRSYEIIVVDTISPMDDTKRLCEENCVKYVLRKGGNSYGDAIRTGIEEANGKYMVIMDADGSHNPIDIIRLYNTISTEEYDVVIGSRYCCGGNTDNPFILKFMSWALNVTYRILFNLKVKDVSNSFKAYKTEDLKGIPLECSDFDIVEEMIIKLNLKYSPIKVKEIPISFSKRNSGESKRDLRKFIRSYLTTIHRLKVLKRRYALERKRGVI